MANTMFSTNNLIKYLLAIGLIYAIFKIVPTQKLSDRDLLLVLGVVGLGLVFIDCGFKESFADTDEQMNFQLDGVDLTNVATEENNIV